MFLNKYRIPDHLVISLILLLLPVAMNSQIEESTDNGLKTYTVETSEGVIEVKLPEKIIAGQTVSGTVVERSYTKKKRDKRGWTIAPGEDYKLSKDGVIIFDPPLLPFVGMTFLLFDRKGKPKKSVELPIKVEPVQDKVEPVFVVDPILVPSTTNTPLKADCDCDGLITTSFATINGEPAPIIAESETQTFIELPENIAGTVHFTFEDKGNYYEGMVQVIQLTIEVGRYQLRTGESTFGTVLVTGLKGYEGDLYLYLKNLSPQNVDISGGNEQLLMIEREKGQDEWGHEFHVLGIQGGNFSILANVVGQ